MNSAGIDYSMSSPGVCIVDNDMVYLYALSSSTKKGVCKLCGTYSFAGVTLVVEPYPSYTNNFDRFTNLSKWTVGKLTQHGIKSVNLEGYAFGAKGQVFDIGENTGILKKHLLDSGITVNIISPNELKKESTGKGNANKVLMVETLENKLQIKFQEILGIKNSTDVFVADIVDAYWLAHYTSKPYLTLSPKI